MPRKKQESPARNEIRDCDIRYWGRHGGVDPAHILAAINKVGRSASTVRKELSQGAPIEGESSF
jgi:hypothetical protein